MVSPYLVYGKLNTLLTTLFCLPCTPGGKGALIHVSCQDVVMVLRGAGVTNLLWLV